MPIHSLPAGLLVLALGAGLTACSSDDADTRTDAEKAAANVGWSPCDDLTAAAVQRVVGEPVEERTGSLTEPQCTFTPQRKGGAAYDISYLWFDGGLDAALDSMGATGGQLEPVDIEGAESARMVVRTQRSGVLVTGFVQTAGLVQSVNAVQVKPYDEDAVVASATALLTKLAAHAPTSPEG